MFRLRPEWCCSRCCGNAGYVIEISLWRDCPPLPQKARQGRGTRYSLIRTLRSRWVVGCIEAGMKHSYLLCVLCALCGSGFSAAALNREAFTITKYDLEIRLEPEQHRLGGRGKITLRNDSEQQQKIAALQISSSL